MLVLYTVDSHFNSVHMSQNYIRELINYTARFLVFVFTDSFVFCYKHFYKKPNNIYILKDLYDKNDY